MSKAPTRQLNVKLIKQSVLCACAWLVGWMEVVCGCGLVLLVSISATMSATITQTITHIHYVLVFVAGWRHALRSEWPFIIIIITLCTRL